MTTPQRITKQSQTRERVIDLMERFGVGNALPSERQLRGAQKAKHATCQSACCVFSPLVELKHFHNVAALPQSH